MDVGPQARVVSQVPAVVVGIFVDHDVVAAPVPVAAVADIERSHAELEAAEPEAAGTAPSEMSDMASAEPAGKVSVLPRVVKVKAGIIVALVMPNPLTVLVNVGSFRMAWAILKRTVGLGGMRRSLKRLRPVVGNVPTSDLVASVLSESWCCQGQENRKKSGKGSHVFASDF